MNSEQIYLSLKNNLYQIAEKYRLLDDKVEIKFKSLSSQEAIGNPKDRDYPIIKGREKMIEATFRNGKGQAFSDEYGDSVYTIYDLIKSPLVDNRSRANFIAAFNAIYRYLGMCDKTIHCKDEEPIKCGKNLLSVISPSQKILLIGLQPRLLESLTQRGQSVRVIDLDLDNIGKTKFGTCIEGPEKNDEAIIWCDFILATGSTIVNNTISKFLNCGKPVLFFGVTISAPARVLELNVFCSEGH